MNLDRWFRSRHDLMLWGMFGGVLLLAVVLVWVALPNDSEKAEPLEQFSVPLHLVADWSSTSAPDPDGSSATAARADAATARPGVVIYLDTSHSMGGYLPPSGAAESSAFRTVAQLIPGHLLGAYGGEVAWRIVDTETRRLDSAPVFGRQLFGGSSTRLELAIREIVDGLHSGQIRGAALVTDLVATGGADGAMGAAQALLPWLASEGIRGRRFDVGILGVRGGYWGMQANQCSSTGTLGCWYSEHAKRYIPLSEPVSRPFFVLLFGLSGDGATVEASLVERVGRGLERSLQELDLDPRWELLTASTRPRGGWLSCSAGRLTEHGRRPQFALYRQTGGQVECRRDEVVDLTCCAALSRPGSPGDCSGTEQVHLLPSQDVPPWPAVSFFADGGHLSIHVDCESLRDEPPQGELGLEGLVTATLPPDPGAFWAGWSVDTDESQESLSGVLQMDLFLETVRVRPKQYQVHAQEPLLRAGGA